MKNLEFNIIGVTEDEMYLVTDKGSRIGDGIHKINVKRIEEITGENLQRVEVKNGGIILKYE